MPTVTVHFGGICTFFLAQHPELDGFCRAVLVNAAHGRIVANENIPPHKAEVQIGNGPRVAVHGLHMRLTSSAESLGLTEFAEACPNLTAMMNVQRNAALLAPSGPVVFDGIPAQAALYFDFKGGTLSAGSNEKGAVVTTLVMQGDAVTLTTSAFVGAEPPPEFPSGFTEDTTILVSNDDDNAEATSPFDFYLHYLTAEEVPDNPPIPTPQQHHHLPVIPGLPRWFGAIGAGCSNSTYP